MSLGLFGRDFTNRVAYVNVNDTGDALFHDHVSRRRDLRDASRLDRGGAAYYRDTPDYEAWLHNLDAFGADLLWIARLPPWALGHPYRRDDAGFPLEADWAEQHPDRFRRVFGSPRVRIYEIVPHT